MFPDLPYIGYSWQITQHAGRIAEDLVRGLLLAVNTFNGQEATNEAIDGIILNQGVLHPESGRSLWRDYQQILYELCLMYPTSLTGKIQLTNVGEEYLSGEISFCELLTLQLAQYQYPNGYKTTMPQETKIALANGGEQFDDLIGLQTHHSVRIKPFVFVWRVIDALYQENPNDAYVTLEEFRQVALRCSSMDELPLCVQMVKDVRAGIKSIPGAAESVVRNANDWAKLLGRTMLFDVGDTRSSKSKISFSDVSINDIVDLRWLFENLSDDVYFWDGDSSDANTWFEEIGDTENPIRKLIADHSRDLFHSFPYVIARSIISEKQFEYKEV